MILALHSTVLSRLCDTVTADEGKLDLSADDFKLVDLLFEYIYTRGYTVKSTGLRHGEQAGKAGAPAGVRPVAAKPVMNNEIDLEVAKTHVGMAELAEKYEMQQLKCLAWEKLEAALRGWTIDEEGLVPQALKDLVGLVYATGHAFTLIRVSIVKKMIDGDSLREACFTNQLKDLMEAYPAFAVDLTTQLARRLGIREKKQRSKGKGKDKDKRGYLYEDKWLCFACKDVFWAYIPDGEGEFVCPECGTSAAADDYALCTDDAEPDE